MIMQITFLSTSADKEDYVFTELQAKQIYAKQMAAENQKYNLKVRNIFNTYSKVIFNKDPINIIVHICLLKNLFIVRQN